MPIKSLIKKAVKPKRNHFTHLDENNSVVEEADYFIDVHRRKSSHTWKATARLYGLNGDGTAFAFSGRGKGFKTRAGAANAVRKAVENGVQFPEQIKGYRRRK